MHRVYSYITTYSSGIPSLVSETEPGTERNPNKVKSKHMGGVQALGRHLTLNSKFKPINVIVV